MRIAVVVLVVFAAIDLLVVGALLAVVWAEHRRQRRIAREVGEPIPPPATGQFALVAAVGLLGLAVLYCIGLLLLDG